MKQTCLWCSQEMGTGGEERIRDSGLVHAVCGCCSEHFTLPPEGPLQKDIDRLPFPVFVLDFYAGSYMITSAVNMKACDWVKKGPHEVIQHLCGNAIECIYAHLPGGCGHTEICRSCAIQQAVLKTSESGEPQVNAMLILQQGERDHPTPVTLSISTMKSGRLVMLRMEQVG
jgi:hypothetical protein